MTTTKGTHHWSYPSKEKANPLYTTPRYTVPVRPKIKRNAAHTEAELDAVYHKFIKLESELDKMGFLGSDGEVATLRFVQTKENSRVIHLIFTDESIISEYSNPESHPIAIFHLQLGTFTFVNASLYLSEEGDYSLSKGARPSLVQKVTVKEAVAIFRNFKKAISKDLQKSGIIPTKESIRKYLLLRTYRSRYWAEGTSMLAAQAIHPFLTIPDLPFTLLFKLEEAIQFSFLPESSMSVPTVEEVREMMELPLSIATELIVPTRR